MALRYSFGLPAEADLLDAAIAHALQEGNRTADIAQPGTHRVSTSGMGDAIIRGLERAAA
jgi:3-isopropylmalate dehydrogenase